MKTYHVRAEIERPDPHRADRGVNESTSYFTALSDQASE